MDRKAYRKAFKEAVNQLNDDQVKQVKDLVKQTLEKLSAAEKERQSAVKKIQLLKKDLDDLRGGRLELIKERHEVDKEADKISPISTQSLEKIILTSPTTWQWKLPIEQSHPLLPQSMGIGNTYSGTITASPLLPVWQQTNSFGCSTDSPNDNVIVTTNCMTQQHGNLMSTACVGTYVLEDGTIKYL